MSGWGDECWNLGMHLDVSVSWRVNTCYTDRRQGGFCRFFGMHFPPSHRKPPTNRHIRQRKRKEGRRQSPGDQWGGAALREWIDVKGSTFWGEGEGGRALFMWVSRMGGPFLVFWGGLTNIHDSNRHVFWNNVFQYKFWDRRIWRTHGIWKLSQGVQFIDRLASRVA